MAILEVLNQFRFCCSCCRLERLNGGFINDTYRVINSNGKKDNFLLQRINHDIFMNAGVILKNISSILNYLYLNDAPMRFKTINLVETKDGRYYYKDRTWHYWRLFQIPGRIEMRDLASTPEDAYLWASVFGRFLSCLDEFPVESRREISFGNKTLIGKLNDFDMPLDPFFNSKHKTVEDEVDYLLKYVKQVAILDQLLECKNATIEWPGLKMTSLN